jgi:hypothetical protein
VQIRYALGADDVGEDGLIFNAGESILFTQSTTIAARAFRDGQAGPLGTARYEVRKALWETHEPEDQSDAVAHEVSDGAILPDGWQLSAASVRGKLHAHRALWREDSFAHATSGVWNIITVSDGAGSAALSRVGSRIACESTLSTLKLTLGNWTLKSQDEAALKDEDLPRLRAILVGAATAALQDMRAEASRREISLNALAATLLILLRAPWQGKELCAALQAGDGSIALLNDDGVTLLGVADHGEHSSETRFLTTSGLEAELDTRVLFSIRPHLRAVAVMSDGVSDDFFPEKERLRELFDQLLPLMESAGEPDKVLLDWLGYEKKGSSDDRTLVLSWNPQAARQPAEKVSDATVAGETGIGPNH